MNYKVIIEKKALKFLDTQNQKQRDRLLKNIYSLPHGDVKKMNGLATYSGYVLVITG